MYGVEQKESRMEKCRVEKESSRGGDELRWGKSGKGYMHEKLGSEESGGKEWRRQDKDRIVPHSCCSPSLPCQFCKISFHPTCSLPSLSQ